MYYTTYRLDIQPQPASENAQQVTVRNLIEQLRKENAEAEHCLDNEGYANKDGKWYDHEFDLKVFSAKHSDYLFILTGCGESDADMWVKYFLNGKMQSEMAEVICPEFDPSKLRR